jgi:hypothetical protein
MSRYLAVTKIASQREIGHRSAQIGWNQKIEPVHSDWPTRPPRWAI